MYVATNATLISLARLFVPHLTLNDIKVKIWMRIRNGKCDADDARNRQYRVNLDMFLMGHEKH